MDVRPVTLEGDVVQLEPMRLAHTEALAAVGLGQDTFRYFPVAIDSPEQMRAYVRHCVAGNEDATLVTWVTALRDTGQVVTSTG
jgi:hypothetical protein